MEFSASTSIDSNLSITTAIWILILFMLIFSSCKPEHKWGYWQIEKSATCLEEGREVSICSFCGKKWYRPRPRLEHKLDADAKCTVCGEQCIDMDGFEKDLFKEIIGADFSSVSFEHISLEEYKISITMSDYQDIPIKVPTFIDIRIESEGIVVYNKTSLITRSDYHGDQAVIFVKKSEITSNRNTANGTIYCKAYNPGFFEIAESAFSVNNLPLKDPNIIIPSLPTTYETLETFESILKITNLSYKRENLNELVFYVSGEKISDHKNPLNLSSYTIQYNFYDSEGKVVSSGEFRTEPLRVGDRFTNCCFSFQDFNIDETYTLEFLNIK